MSGVVLVSGDFSSGTTLLFTLFRHADDTHCLYEPLHERLLHFLIWPPRQYEGHSFVEDYFGEYKGFDAIPRLFDPAWGTSRLHLGADSDAPRLRRYLAYLIEMSHHRAPTAVLKENRFTFRLAWLRRHFPQARIVNVYRDRDEQWGSWVRRAQEHLGRQDVGQDSADFMAFRLAAWCDELADTYPELAAERCSSGYERFSRLWQLSRDEHERHAHVCVNLSELRSDFPLACARISKAVGLELDPAHLAHLVAPERGPRDATRTSRRDRVVDRIGMRYAEARVRLQRRYAAADTSSRGRETAGE